MSTVQPPDGTVLPLGVTAGGTAGIPVPALSAATVADLRTDHAGETGAVCIYRGVLAISRDAPLRDFARRHLATEQQHLAIINTWLAAPERSRLLPLWRLSGWLTGALPALFGPRAVYATIAAVETFVDRHYQAQVDQLNDQPALAPLRADLESCRQDEAHHRDEAAAQAGSAPGWLLRLWCAVVGHGSSAAVSLCRHV
jgi:3-demethoxyubiquinol 3-hydroxylase